MDGRLREALCAASVSSGGLGIYIYSQLARFGPQWRGKIKVLWAVIRSRGGFKSLGSLAVMLGRESAMV